MWLTVILSSFLPQESKDGAVEEEEKQGENGKKEEERGREPEGEREAEKTDSEMGMNVMPFRWKKGIVVLSKN